MSARRTDAERFAGRTTPGPNGCLLWTGPLNDDGYGVLPHGRKAHRAVYSMHHGTIPGGLEVRHSCDVRACVNPDHLHLGTHLENMGDMVARGRSRACATQRSGERNSRAKLTDAQVSEIRLLFARGALSQGQIGKTYGVSQTTVSEIVRGRSRMTGEG